MTLKPDSMVESVLYDLEKDKASGVRVIDAKTMEVTEYHAKVIFLCASTLGTTHIMFNSANSRFPNGLVTTVTNLGEI